LGSTLRCTAVAAFTRAAAVGTLLPAGIVFLAHFRVAAAAALHIAAVFAAVFLAATVAAGFTAGASGSLFGHRAFRARLCLRRLGKCDDRKNERERKKSDCAFHGYLLYVEDAIHI